MQGIYKLEFKDGSVYIGQAKDIRNRWSQHLRDMESNKHVNKMVQAKFDLFGFPIMEVLQYTSDLDARESAFIKEYSGPLLLNIRGCTVADQLKSDALLMMQQGTRVAEVSQLLNIPASTLYRWRNEARPDPKLGQAAKVSEVEQRIQKLENQILEVVNWARCHSLASTDRP